jgi:hypothetical protein
VHVARAASANPARLLPALGVQCISMLLTLPLAPSDRLQQEAAASLCTGTADPSAADYLLVALLFAWRFNGDASALKGWCSDGKTNISIANATWQWVLPCATPTTMSEHRPTA